MKKKGSLNIINYEPSNNSKRRVSQKDISLISKLSKKSSNSKETNKHLFLNIKTEAFGESSEEFSIDNENNNNKNQENQILKRIRDKFKDNIGNKNKPRNSINASVISRNSFSNSIIGTQMKKNNINGSFKRQNTVQGGTLRRQSSVQNNINGTLRRQSSVQNNINGTLRRQSSLQNNFNGTLRRQSSLRNNNNEFLRRNSNINSLNRIHKSRNSISFSLNGSSQSSKNLINNNTRFKIRKSFSKNNGMFMSRKSFSNINTTTIKNFKKKKSKKLDFKDTRKNRFEKLFRKNPNGRRINSNDEKNYNVLKIDDEDNTKVSESINNFMKRLKDKEVIREYINGKVIHYPENSKPNSKQTSVIVTTREDNESNKLLQNILGKLSIKKKPQISTTIRKKINKKKRNKWKILRAGVYMIQLFFQLKKMTKLSIKLKLNDSNNKEIFADKYKNVRNYFLNSFLFLRNFSKEYFFNKLITYKKGDKKEKEENAYIIKLFIHYFFESIFSFFAKNNSMTKFTKLFIRELISEGKILPLNYLTTFEFNRLEFNINFELKNVTLERQGLLISYLIFYRFFIYDIFNNITLYYPDLKNEKIKINKNIQDFIPPSNPPKKNEKNKDEEDNFSYDSDAIKDDDKRRTKTFKLAQSVKRYRKVTIPTKDNSNNTNMNSSKMENQKIRLSKKQGDYIPNKNNSKNNKTKKKKNSADYENDDKFDENDINPKKKKSQKNSPYNKKKKKNKKDNDNDDYGNDEEIDDNYNDKKIDDNYNEDKDNHPKINKKKNAKNSPDNSLNLQKNTNSNLYDDNINIYNPKNKNNIYYKPIKNNNYSYSNPPSYNNQIIPFDYSKTDDRKNNSVNHPYYNPYNYNDGNYGNNSNNYLDKLLPKGKPVILPYLNNINHFNNSNNYNILYRKDNSKDNGNYSTINYLNKSNIYRSEGNNMFRMSSNNIFSNDNNNFPSYLSDRNNNNVNSQKIKLYKTPFNISKNNLNVNNNYNSINYNNNGFRGAQTEPRQIFKRENFSGFSSNNMNNNNKDIINNNLSNSNTNINNNNNIIINSNPMNKKVNKKKKKNTVVEKNLLFIGNIIHYIINSKLKENIPIYHESFKEDFLYNLMVMNKKKESYFDENDENELISNILFQSEEIDDFIRENYRWLEIYKLTAYQFGLDIAQRVMDKYSY